MAKGSNDSIWVGGASCRRRVLAAVCLGLVVLSASVSFAAPPAGVFAAIQCEGTYPGHLQGICTDNKDSVFWSFTTELVKTGRHGKIVKKIPVASHHGDLCFVDGKVYVAVNLGQFNQPEGKADSWVYVYDAGLKELAWHKVPEAVHGAGGMGYRDGRFFVVGGLPQGINENYVYEYDKDFHFIKRHVIESGYTLMGIQTAAYADGCWWFGCYGKPHELLKTDKEFHMIGRYPLDCAYGIVGMPGGSLLIGQHFLSPSESKMKGGRAVVATPDSEKGLVFRESK